MPFNDSKDNQQNLDVIPLQEATSGLKVLTQEVIPLLEERLMVNLTQRKIGEIVVRKEVDTYILQVEVPIRREKLIVEQVEPEYERLAEINLGQANISNKDYIEVINTGSIPVEQSKQLISTEFNQSIQPMISGEIKWVHPT